MSLFINTIADSLAGTATFSLPACDGTNNFVIVDGFLVDNPTINMKNEWGSLLPDITSLNDYAQLAGVGMTSWLSTSKAAWRGTDPITLTLSFYLLTYRKAQIDGTGTGRDLPVSKQAAYFAQLAALRTGDHGIDVGVHGGYRPDVYQRNSDFAGAGKTENMANPESNKWQFLTKWTKESLTAWDEDSGNGTIQIIINGGGKPSMVFTKMLLADVTFNPSTVRAGYWTTKGDRGKISSNMVFVPSKEPLFIKVDATFRLMHSATVQDAVRMFTGGASL